MHHLILGYLKEFSGFVPASVDRDDSAFVQRGNRAEVVVTALHAKALHVPLACSLQCEVHGHSGCVESVGSERDQA